MDFQKLEKDLYTAIMSILLTRQKYPTLYYGGLIKRLKNTQNKKYTKLLSFLYTHQYNTNLTDFEHYQNIFQIIISNNLLIDLEILKFIGAYTSEINN